MLIVVFAQSFDRMYLKVYFSLFLIFWYSRHCLDIAVPEVNFLKLKAGSFVLRPTSKDAFPSD